MIYLNYKKREVTQFIHQVILNPLDNNHKITIIFINNNNKINKQIIK